MRDIGGGGEVVDVIDVDRLNSDGSHNCIVSVTKSRNVCMSECECM
jgi:hypothetical protein